jgi:hypothetical protein
MRQAPVSRITGTLSIAAILLGGTMTNCGSCGDVHPTGGAQSDQGAPGPQHQVTGCPTGTKSAASLRACSAAPTGPSDLKLYPVTLFSCPDSKTGFSATEPFSIYWTICNTANAAPASTQPYQLVVTSQDSPPHPVPTPFDFVQPALDACGCTDVVVTFDTPGESDPKKVLTPGSYRFALTGVYATAASKQALVNP